MATTDTMLQPKATKQMDQLAPEADTTSVGSGTPKSATNMNTATGPIANAATDGGIINDATGQQSLGTGLTANSTSSQQQSTGTGVTANSAVDAASPDANTTPQPAPATPAAPTGGGVVNTAQQNGMADAAWQPSTGLSTNISQADTQQANAGGYTAQTGGQSTSYQGQGYDAQGYVPSLAAENMSQAVSRITDQNGVLMQRAGAMGEQAANARGLVNSSMGVQAGQAAMLDQAIPIAQGDIQTGMFNAQQANDAARFTADAKNQAAQFSANATNMANQFNAGQAQQMAMFAADQYNKAAEFAAQANNAASMFNAQAYNEARQKFVDAVNAARAAEQDARNMALRDAAVFKNQRDVANIGANATVNAAQIHASATMGAAQLQADSAAAAREWQGHQNDIDREQNRARFDTQMQFNIDSMGQDAFNRYQAGMTAIMTAQMEPEARTAAINNYNAMWAGNPYLPMRINTGGGSSATTGTTTNTNSGGTAVRTR